MSHHVLLLSSLASDAMLQDPSPAKQRELQTLGMQAAFLVQARLITYQHAVALVKAARRTKLSIASLSGIHTPQPIVTGCELVKVGLLTAAEVFDACCSDINFACLWQDGRSHAGIYARLKFLTARSLNRLVQSGKMPLPQAQRLCEPLLAMNDGKEVVPPLLPLPGTVAQRNVGWTSPHSR
jgi:hypothetical protein